MNPIIINGKSLASELKKQLSDRIVERKSSIGLAIVLVGEDSASQIYVANKLKACKQVGITPWLHQIPQDTDMDTVIQLLDGLNHDERVHGIIVQLPLPPQLDTTKIINSVSPTKDVDGLHPSNQAALYLNQQQEIAFIPCTPLACLYLIKQVHSQLSGLHVAVVGRSHLVGRPLSSLLLQADCSVSIVHSKSHQPQRITAEADVVVSAAGVPKLITAEWIKEGATVIDVGIHRIQHNHGTRLCGDVAYDEVLPKVKAITPVPGGVGPMTVACLLENCYKAAL